MQAQCILDPLEFEGFDGPKVVAGFDGGAITSDAGALLLRHVDRVTGLFKRVTDCFMDGRDPNYTVHSVRTLVGQRIAAIALGYEDVDDHDTLRHDPVLGLVFRVPRSFHPADPMNTPYERATGFSCGSRPGGEVRPDAAEDAV